MLSDESVDLFQQRVQEEDGVTPDATLPNTPPVTEGEEAVVPKKEEEEVIPEKNTPEDLFHQIEEETINEEDEEEKREHSTINTLHSLKELGILEIEEELSEELTEEEAAELLETKWEDSIEGKLKAVLNDLPEEVKNLNLYVLKGGTAKEYYKTLGNIDTSIPLDLDMTDLDSQKQVVKKFLLEDDMDEETIEAQIELLENSGKLQNYASKKYDKWKTAVQTEKSNILANQETTRKIAAEGVKTAVKKATTFLKSATEIGDITVSPALKKKLPQYIYDTNVPIQGGKKISAFQEDLFYKTLNNEKATIQLAILMQNRNEDGTFNFANIKKQLKTNTTNRIKQNLKNKKIKPYSSGSGGNTGSKRSLASLFDD